MSVITIDTLIQHLTDPVLEDSDELNTISNYNNDNTETDLNKFKVPELKKLLENYFPKSVLNKKRKPELIKEIINLNIAIHPNN